MTIDEPAAPDLTDFRGESFQKGHAPADRDRDLAALVFILDVQEDVPGIQRLRDWSLQALDPQPGEVALDVGCGTGAEVRRLATLVGPTGRAVGLEPHAGLRSVAEARAAAETSAAELLDGDALALPFEDASVDVVRSERVFQHLPDPEGAAAEIARVLRPGGRVVIIDSDWGSLVTSPGQPDVQRAVAESMWARTPNPFAGRYLKTHLQRAGLVVDPDIGSTAVLFPDEFLADPVMLRQNAATAIEDGRITPAQATALEEEFVAAAQRGEAFMAVTMFAAVGRKPQR